MRKILLFCNRRAEVEEISGQCKAFWPEDHIVVHHGKLDRSVREESESFMRECRWGLCVATMTLEIGIDIGDIDVVMLYGAPWSVSSLLQRVGRGNRRKGMAIAFGISREPDERVQFEQLFELAKIGSIEEKSYNLDLSIIVQQVLSCLYQNPGGLEENYLISLLGCFSPPEQLMLILSHLRKVGYLEWRQGKWFASTKVMDMGDMGIIHSNISSVNYYKVIDIASGISLGSISMPVIESIFRLAGKAWEVVNIEGSKIYVRPSKGGQTAQFGSTTSKGAFSRLLPPELRISY
jgi:ATP-dependent Lhr-like helicase